MCPGGARSRRVGAFGYLERRHCCISGYVEVCFGYPLGVEFREGREEAKAFTCIGVQRPLAGVTSKRGGTHITVQREGKGVTRKRMEDSLDELGVLLKDVRSIGLMPMGAHSAEVVGVLADIVEGFRSTHGGAGDVYTEKVHVELVARAR